MQNPAISPERREWIHSVVKDIRKGVPEPEVPEEPGKEAEDEEPFDTFGDAYKMIDPRPLSTDLQNAFTRSGPKKMPSATDWNGAAVVPGPGIRNRLLDNNANPKPKDALTALTAIVKDRTVAENNLKLLNKLKKRIEDHKALPPPRAALAISDLLPNAPDVTDAQLNGRQIWTNNKITEWEGKKNTADTAGENIKGPVSDCLTLLEAPENNPERKRVGEALAGLEAIEKQIEKNGGRLNDELAQKKSQALADLEKQLHLWQDRRAQEMLPPSAEAVALGDHLQTVHEQLIKDVIAGPLALPLPDEDKLSPEEKLQARATWNNLRAGTLGPGSRLSAPLPAVDGKHIKNAGEAEQFQLETMTNFARLLGLPAGRDLLNKLNAGDKTVTVAPDEEAACSRGVGALPTDTSSKESALSSSGGGGHSTVKMPLGFKASSSAMNTKDGIPLYNPTSLIMGHELVHALHNSRGVNLRNVTKPIGFDPLWNNMEEWETINRGEESEQVLRDQYNLPAERFGHISQTPKEDMANALKNSIDDMENLQKYEAQLHEGKPPRNLDQVLLGKGFDPATLTSKLKVEIAKDDAIKTPLPQGWVANQLTVKQIKEIIELKLRAGLPALGWAPYGLEVKGTTDQHIQQIIKVSLYHPRSPTGRKYVGLGGDSALAKIDGFNTAAGTALGKGNTAHWPSRIDALEAALAAVTSMEKSTAVVKLKNDLAQHKKLLPKMEAAIAVLSGTGADATNAKSEVTTIKDNPLLFGDDALSYFKYAGGTPGVGAAKNFLEGKQVELARRDGDLTAAGHTPSGMTLVARARALAGLDKLAGAGTADALMGLLQGECAGAIPGVDIRASVVGPWNQFKALPPGLDGVVAWGEILAEVENRGQTIKAVKDGIAGVPHPGTKSKLETLAVTVLDKYLVDLKNTTAFKNAEATKGDVDSPNLAENTKPAQRIMTDFAPTWTRSKENAERNFRQAVSRFTNDTRDKMPGKKPTEDPTTYLTRRLGEMNLVAAPTFAKQLVLPAELDSMLGALDSALKSKAGVPEAKANAKRVAALAIAAVQTAAKRWGQVQPDFCIGLLQTLKDIAGSINVMR
jgi:hypothetical protein